MPDRVADASVLAAIAFGEPRAREALRLLRGADLVLPILLRYELASIARKKSVKDPAKRGEIERALEWGLAIAASWVDVDHVRVMGLALETGLSTYDASYLYVARSTGARLATFDERLRRAAR